MQYYSGNRAPFVYVLFSERDTPQVKAVAEAMEGIRFAPLNSAPQLSQAKRACAVIAFLSASFGENQSLCDAFFALKDAQVPIIPVRLDSAALPQTIEQALYARNSILAEKYGSSEELAQRILTAPALAAPAVTAAQKKAARRTTGILAGALAVMMVAGVLFLVSRLRQPEEKVQVVEQVNMLGLTQSDLEKIVGVMIVGDRVEFFEGNRVYMDNGTQMEAVCFSQFSPDNDCSPVWPSGYLSLWDDFAEPLTKQDLSVLSMLPNLATIDLIRVEADSLPDLSGLQNLNSVILRGCRIPDLSGLSGSSVKRLEFSMARGTDLSVLTGCTQLNKIVLDACGMEPDFTGFAPPNLMALDIYWSAGFYVGEEEFHESSQLTPQSGIEWVYNTPLWDLSELEQASSLKILHLDNIPVTNVQFLQGMPQLEELTMTADHLLSDSGLENMTSLRRLTITEARNLSDLPAVNTCKQLEYFYLRNFGNSACDMSFLNGLTKLKDIHLPGCYPDNVDFLKTLPDNGELNLTVDVWSDASGLAAITHYQNLYLGLRSNEPLAYLQGAKVTQSLTIYGGNDLELSLLPEPGQRLELVNCNVKDLAQLGEMGWNCASLRLSQCSSLRSLTGIENWDALREVDIYDCARLQDMTALENKKLETLCLVSVPAVPELAGMDVSKSLTLNNIFTLTDLSGLDALKTTPETVALLQLSAVADPQPLQNLRGGELYVNPGMERFAALMVGSGNFESYKVLEQDQYMSISLKLESLEDLQLFPETMLSQIRELYVMGDTLYDPSEYFTTFQWAGQTMVPTLAKAENGELVYLETGSGTIDSIELLSRLTGLETLCLEKQPLTSLEGIERLSCLKQLKVAYCDKLTDVSAAFLLDRLERLELNNTAVTSIQGIENLPRLQYLDVEQTKITDLSPLAMGDYSYSAQLGGAVLRLSGTGSQSTDFLQGFSSVSCLDLQGVKTDIKAVLRQLGSSHVKKLYVDALPDDEALRLIADQCPDLTDLTIYSSPTITDLTPLLQLEKLQFVQLSGLSNGAYQSLSGQSVSFQLNIW